MVDKQKYAAAIVRKVESLRKSKRWTEKDIASQLGISRQYYSEIVTNHSKFSQGMAVTIGNKFPDLIPDCHIFLFGMPTTCMHVKAILRAWFKLARRSK